jgi:TolB-like protein
MPLFIALLVVSCVSPQYKAGLAFMEQGDYGQAYKIFTDLSSHDPGNPDYYEHRQTASRLEYRRRMALAREALLKGDLTAFLDHVNTAGELTPNSTAAELARLVKSSRANGQSDRAIIRTLLRSLQADGMAVEATTGLAITAEAIAEAVAANKIPTPLLVLPFAPNGDVPVIQANTLRNQLIEELTRRNIQVVDRTLLAKIMEERKFQQSDLVDPATCTEVGKLLGAAAFLTADLTRETDNIRLQFRAIKVATAETAWSDSTLVKGK